jgi:hypothetical protein
LRGINTMLSIHEKSCGITSTTNGNKRLLYPVYDTQFRKFQQQLLLPNFLKENSCLNIRLVSFQVNYLAKTKAFVLYLHTYLQVAGIRDPEIF